MRLLLDDTLPAELVQRLQLLNHDVATVGTHPELRGAPDAVVFASACRELRALVTTNAVDFLVLAGEHDHSGLVVTTVQRVSGKAGRDVCARAAGARDRPRARHPDNPLPSLVLLLVLVVVLV